MWDEYESSSGVEGLMRGIKIPQQDFALKRQGGLCARGGVFVGHYGTFKMQTKKKQKKNDNTHTQRGFLLGSNPETSP